LKMNKNGEFQKTFSKNLKVGNIIKINEHEFFPADVLVLSKPFNFIRIVK